MVKNLKSKSQWVQYYENKSLFNKVKRNINLHVFDKEFIDIIQKFLIKRSTFIEMGCGNSNWLPYVCERYGCEVSGIDYLEKACSLAKKKLMESLCNHYQIFFGDFNELFMSIHKKFDVLMSYGVIEHFQAPQEILSVFSKYMNDNSTIITHCPNTTGLCMAIQKWIDNEVYEGHQRFSLEEFIKYHEVCGFEVLYAGYIGYLSFNNLDFSCYGKKGLLIKGFIKVFNSHLVLATYLLKRMGWFKIQNRKLSGNMVVVAKKLG